MTTFGSTNPHPETDLERHIVGLVSETIPLDALIEACHLDGIKRNAARACIAGLVCGGPLKSWNANGQRWVAPAGDNPEGTVPAPDRVEGTYPPLPRAEPTPVYTAPEPGSTASTSSPAAEARHGAPGALNDPYRYGGT